MASNLEQAAKPCKICATLSLLRLPPVGDVTEVTFGDLQSSATSCQLCKMLQEVVEFYEPCREAREAGTFMWERGYEWDDEVGDKVNLGPQFLWYPKMDSADGVRCMRAFTLRQGNAMRQLPFAPFGQMMPENTSSEESLGWAKHQIELCNQNHQCWIEESSSLPNRVLDVSGQTLDSDVKLYLTTNEHARYLCLSHCWGVSGSPIRTTRDSFDENIRGISFCRLPKTFQDAVMITRSLNIRYLWIDSLCIVQGDDEDWLRESSNMASIYENAYLTIAATASDNSNGGCYRQIPSTYQDTQFQYVSTDGTMIPVFFRETIEHTDFRDRSDLKAEECPLLQRGWVFQEQILSSRFLQFRRRELLFECKLASDCQCKDSKQDAKRRLAHLFTLDSIHDPYAENWNEVVNYYTSLSTTFERDRLPAISGLARRMYTRHEDTYLAGVWKSQLPASLRWVTSRYHEKRGRPAHPRAPTWSWASTLSGVIYQSYSGYDFHIEILGAECTPVGNDIFGQFESGMIKIEGKVTPSLLHWKFIDGPPKLESPKKGEEILLSWSLDAFMNMPQYNISDLECGNLKFIPDYDFREEFTSPMEVKCLWLCHRGSNGSVLILRPVSDNDYIFERIGYLSVSGDKFWYHAETQDLTLQII